MNITIKRNIINFIVFFITISTFSQITQKYSGISQIPEYSRMGGATTKNNIGSENLNSIEAKVYLYPTYNNTAVISTTTNRKYSISNINLNLYSNSFDSEMSSDSLYVFDNKWLKSVVINNTMYKVYFDLVESDYKIYRVIYENDNFSLLRLDKILSKEIRDPLNINPPKISFGKGINYYVKNNSEITKISLRKKPILELLKDKKNIVMAYAKKYRLSFNKEKDLEKIFEYYNSL